MCNNEHINLEQIDFQEIENWLQSDNFKSEINNISEEEKIAVVQIKEMISVKPEDLERIYHHYF